MSIPFHLLAITDGRAASREDFPRLDRWLDLQREAGVQAVQIREKRLSDRDLFELVLRLRRHFQTPARLLVNSRFDIAMAAGADGVHLPATGLSPRAIRRETGPRFLIGCSTHSDREVATARSDGADYITYGPIFETASKKAYGPPRGLAELQRAVVLAGQRTRDEARDRGLSVLALGGVIPEKIADVARAGAHGGAAIGAFSTPASALAMVVLASESFDRKNPPEGPVPEPSPRPETKAESDQYSRLENRR